MRKFLLMLLFAATSASAATSLETSSPQMHVKREVVRSDGTVDYFVDEVTLDDGTVCVVIGTSTYTRRTTSCDFSKRK